MTTISIKFDYIIPQYIVKRKVFKQTFLNKYLKVKISRDFSLLIFVSYSVLA